MSQGKEQKMDQPSRERVLAVLQANAEALLPERAEGWEAVLRFEVADLGPYTMTISGGEARVAPGAEGDSTCVIRLAAETLVGLGTGEVEGPKAFMQGLITATNMTDMMRFATCFDGRKVARLVRERLAGEAPPAESGAEVAAPEGLEGLNKQSVGWTYEGTPTVADPQSIGAYVQATGDDNPRYADPTHPGGVVAPPMYVVRPMKETLFMPLLDPRVNANLLRLLHGEQDMRFYHLLRPGDQIQTRSEITEILDKSSGQILRMRISCERAGQLTAEALVTVFIRAPGKGAGQGPASPAGEAGTATGGRSAEEPAWTFEQQVEVGADQPLRYAEASLDNNPIHTEEAVARAAGLRTNILQGLCTMAFCQQAVIQHVAGGDPGRLRRLKVRFAQPVFPGDTLTVQGRRGAGLAAAEAAPGEGAGEVVELRAVNQAGEEVIVGGLAEVS